MREIASAVDAQEAQHLRAIAERGCLKICMMGGNLDQTTSFAIKKKICFKYASCEFDEFIVGRYSSLQAARHSGRPFLRIISVFLFGACYDRGIPFFGESVF